MANVNAPRGFTLVKGSSRRPLKRYYKSASVAIGVGDPVIRTATSASPEGHPAVTRATTGAAITGIVVGVEPTRSDLSKLYLPSGTSGYLLVCDDPDALFEVQEGGSGTALAVDDIGLHIDAVAAIDCNSTTGRSNYELDKGAVATNNTFVLVELAQREGNAVGAYAKWIVKPNLHTEANASASNVTEI